MGKARMLGMKSSYIPNSRADMRFNQKLYRRGREYTDRHEAVMQEVRERRDLEQLERMKANANG